MEEELAFTDLAHQGMAGTGKIISERGGCSNPPPGCHGSIQYSGDKSRKRAAQLPWIGYPVHDHRCKVPSWKRGLSFPNLAHKILSDQEAKRKTGGCSFPGLSVPKETSHKRG